MKLKFVEIQRVSTYEQAGDDGAGLDRQADANRRTAAREGGEIIATFRLVGISRVAFALTPEWQRIQELIRSPDTHIVVEAVDRFVADYPGIQILQECARVDARIYTSSGLLDANNAYHKMILALQAFKSGDELTEIRRRVQGGKESKRRAGIFPSSRISLPTGIDFIREKGGGGRWSYTERADTIREMFRLVVEDGFRNWTEVARKVGLASGVTVRNLLRCPIYKGLWVVSQRRASGNGSFGPDGQRKDRAKVNRPPEDVIRIWVFRPLGTSSDWRHASDPGIGGAAREEALVSEAVWDQAQRIVQTKTAEYLRPRAGEGAGRFVFSGFLWCGSCGSRMHSKTRPRSGRSSGRRDWYVCAKNAAGVPCTTKYVPAKVASDAIEYLVRVDLSDQRLASTLVRAGMSAQEGDFAVQAAAATRAANAARGRLSRLLPVYLEGKWSLADLHKNKAAVEGEVERAEREVARIAQLQAARDRVTMLSGLLDAIGTLSEFDFWSRQEKRAFLRKFLPRIELSATGIERLHLQLPVLGWASGPPSTENPTDPIPVAIARPWHSLRPPARTTEFGLVEKEFYSRRDVKAAMRITESQLKRLLKAGTVPEPASKVAGKRAWTVTEMRMLLSSRT